MSLKWSVRPRVMTAFQWKRLPMNRKSGPEGDVPSGTCNSGAVSPGVDGVSRSKRYDWITTSYDFIRLHTTSLRRHTTTSWMTFFSGRPCASVRDDDGPATVTLRHGL